MQSRTEDFAVEVEASAPRKKQPKCFELYEEYSQTNIAETIQTRRDAYEKAALQARMDLEAEVEIEVENFHIWLEMTKKLEPFVAHYYSTSLKSLLLGIPKGAEIAQLFDVVLQRLKTP